MIERLRSNVPLYEEFMERAWTYYDSYEAETRKHLAYQNHVDLRSFVAVTGENWTRGNTGFNATYGNFPVLEISASGTTETESATPNHPVDLLTGFVDSDLFTFALPNFPLEVINVNQSRIEITSDARGHCSNTKQTAVLSFSAGIKSPIKGNNQFVVERSALKQNEINLEKITGVRFKIVCNGESGGIVIIMGLRLILAEHAGKTGWALASVDYDNWSGMLRKPTPLNGETSTASTFIQGTLWKSDLLPGPNDPMPVDAEFGIVFNTGAQQNKNEIVLYVREEPLIFQTQLDLIGVTQAELDGHPQPDLGTIEFAPRTLGEMDKQPMSQLDHKVSMESLERLPVENPTEQSWVYFAFRWGEGTSRLTMANSVSPGYVFPKVASFLSNTEYLMTCSVEDSSARVRIYQLNPDKSVKQEPVFDSTLIEDDGVFRRRKGRVGWKATLGDANAYVRSIRPRNIVFAEYKSAPLMSFTPVDGAQLFAAFSSNEELWNREFTLYPPETNAARLSRDTVRTTDIEIPGQQEGDSDKLSFRVDTTGAERKVGIATGPIRFSNFSQAEIHFSIWFSGQPQTREKKETKVPAAFPGRIKFAPFFPSGGYTTISETPVGNIEARLVSEEGTVVPLTMPELEPNQWQKVILRIPEEQIVQTGKYYLQILQPTLFATTWWVDAIFIFERAVQWSARSVVSDPWNSIYAPWTDFREIVNVNHKGILLSPRGKELQLRARALRQDAIVKAPKIVPRYASLGRLVWPEEKLQGKTGPKAAFLATGIEPALFRFVGSSTEGTAPIISRTWDFGDGSFEAGNNVITEHRYVQKGEYTATLVVTDRNGLRGVVEHEILVV
jgi:hypothetical protein